MECIINAFDGEVDNSQIQNWLDQFEQSERSYLVKLLPYFKYYSAHRFESIIRKLPNQIEQASKVSPHKATYIPIGNIEDSGSLGLYLYLQGLSPSLIKTQTLDNLKECKDKQIILFDDFVETGQHASFVWNNYIKPLHLKNKVIFTSIVGTKEGAEYLKHKTDYLLVFGETLDLPRPLQPKSGFILESDSQVLMEIMIKYAKKLFPTGVYSQNIDQGILLGFFYNTPKKTFPIFWSTENGWKPLLPYRSNENLSECKREKESYSVAKRSKRKPWIQAVEDVDIPGEVITHLITEFHTLPIVTRIAPVFAKLSIEIGTIIWLMKLINKLKYANHEKTDIRTALFIPILDRAIHYQKNSRIVVEEGLRIDKLDKAETIATVFDGFDAATVVSPKGDILGVITYDIEEVDKNLFPLRYYKPMSISNDGALFLFLGKGRVQLIANGDVLATHRATDWYLHSMEILDNTIQMLSENHRIAESIIRDVIRIAYLISDQEKGALITLGDHEIVLQNGQPSNNDGYKWRSTKLDQKSDETLVGLMSQDKATVITCEGVVFQNRISLNPQGEENIVEETGKGTKHLIAAKTSAVTEAICIAVSVNGSISIYSQGTLVYRTII